MFMVVHLFTSQTVCVCAAINVYVGACLCVVDVFRLVYVFVLANAFVLVMCLYCVGPTVGDSVSVYVGIWVWYSVFMF